MSNSNQRVTVLLGVLFILAGCGGDESDSGLNGPLFQQIDPSVSGLTFANMISEDLEINMLSFEYLLNGAGVSVGDVNGDSLPDIYMVGTQVGNKLYINEGDLAFSDVTAGAGVGGRPGSISTGSTMADIDGDGDLDIYVCNTGNPGWDINRQNQLFINDGNGSFTEAAEEWGLASESFSNHATFFDYDGDHDLDVYLINHPTDFSRANEVRPNINAPEPFSSDQFFRNDGSSFTDVSEEAGVRNHAFGLSATVGDLNDDGRMDVLVANDYVIPDFMYINNGDGTFTDRGQATMPHTAHSGMGSDVADINNDGFLDIVILDMMAEDARRQRLLGSMMMYDRYQILKDFGYGDQIQRNVLQLNNGDGTYSDIGHMAGIAETDWSWGPLLADYDLDGFRDLFIANGYRRDVTNQDYMQFTIDSLRRAGGGEARVTSIYEYLDVVPSEKLQNYAYRNRGDMTFEDVSAAWGLDDETFSNGSAYGDMDADGDIDLVVNDIDGTVRLYENKADELLAERHWLQVAFNGPQGNNFGIGARVTVTSDSLGEQVAENVSSRGFYSSVPPELSFGFGEDAGSLSVHVKWPDGRVQEIESVAVDQRIVLNYNDSIEATDSSSMNFNPLFLNAENTGVDFRHVEDPFVDFKRDLLIPHMHSREGPFMSAGDVNDDGLDDFFVGGATGQSGRLYLQSGDGRFEEVSGPWMNEDAGREDTRTHFFDANADGHLDLYVASGGSHLTPETEGAAVAYQDRIYFGDGTGQFEAGADNTLPQMPVPTGAVASGDIDGDGDLDLFIGGRVLPGSWPTSPPSFVLRNENGRFTDVTASVAPEFSSLGLVSGASFADVNGDGSSELVVIGEWMPPQVWSLEDGNFSLVENNGLGDFSGWWNTLSVVDLDGDGDLDIFGGNLGLNSRISGSIEQPVRVYAKDFDSNGTIDPILTLYYSDGGEYPIHRRENMMKQLPYLQQRFPRFNHFASSTLENVFRPEELDGALVVEAGWFATTWFENDGTGNFVPHELPLEAQVAPVYASVFPDVNADGQVDILLAGNSRSVDVERGPYDAGRGLLLQRTGGGHEVIRGFESGLSLPGDVRSLLWLNTPSGALLLVGNNDEQMQLIQVRNESASGSQQ